MKEFRYLQVRSLGNYEKAELEVKGVIEDGSKPQTVVSEGMQFVGKALYGHGEFAGAMVTSTKEVVAAGKVEKTTNAASTTKEDKKVEVKKAEEKKEEVKKEEVKTEAKVEEKKSEETKAEVKKEEVKEEKKEAKKGKINKNTPYNREDDKHKAVLGKYLDEKIGADWREDKDKLKKVGPASRAMVGKDFLDSEGEVLQSFCDEFIKLYEA